MDVDSEMTETHPTESAASITSSSAASASDVRPAVQQREIKLTSVLQLRNTIENDMHSGTRYYYRVTLEITPVPLLLQGGTGKNKPWVF